MYATVEIHPYSKPDVCLVEKSNVASGTILCAFLCFPLGVAWIGSVFALFNWKEA